MNDYVNYIFHEVHVVKKTPINTKKVTKKVVFIGKSNKKSKNTFTNKKKGVTKKKKKSYWKNKVVVMVGKKKNNNDKKENAKNKATKRKKIDVDPDEDNVKGHVGNIEDDITINKV